MPVMRFEDLDGPPIVVKVLGEQGWENLSRKIDAATPHRPPVCGAAARA